MEAFILSDEEVMRAVYAVGEKRKPEKRKRSEGKSEVAKEGADAVVAGGHTEKKRKKCKKGAETTPIVAKESAEGKSEVAKEGADAVEAGGHTKKK